LRGRTGGSFLRFGRASITVFGVLLDFHNGAVEEARLWQLQPRAAVEAALDSQLPGLVLLLLLARDRLSSTQLYRVLLLV